MVQVSRNNKISLPITVGKIKYFYLTNSNYYSYSNYIYICFYDSDSILNYNSIKYCLTNTYPESNLDSVVNSCSFTSINYSSNKSFSGKTEYYYKIPTNSSYTYSIVYYNGSSTYGALSVISDYNELFKSIKMTQVYKISRTSLPTSSSYNKYFYLKNKYTISDTSYTYICLEDDGFGLSYNNVKCCLRAYNPSSNPDNAVNYCTSPLINYYSIQSSSGTTKYFYKIPVAMSVYEYSIVYYEGNYSFGSLYVIYDYNDLSSIITTQVLINSRISLPTNSSLDKYFYITNKDFSKYSSDNIYFYLEYQGFNLN